MTMPVAGVWSVDQTESAAVLVGCQRSRFFKYMDKITLGMTLIPIATICGMFFLLRKKYKIDETEYARLVEELDHRRG